MSCDATRVVLSGTDTLADSCSSLLQTFYFLVNNLGVSIGSAVQMLAETPARFLSARILYFGMQFLCVLCMIFFLTCRKDLVSVRQ